MRVTSIVLSTCTSLRVVFDAVAPQVLRFLSVLRGANTRSGKAFALRETPLWTHSRSIHCTALCVSLHLERGLLAAALMKTAHTNSFCRRPRLFLFIAIIYCDSCVCLICCCSCCATCIYVTVLFCSRPQEMERFGRVDVCHMGNRQNPKEDRSACPTASASSA